MNLSLRLPPGLLSAIRLSAVARGIPPSTWLLLALERWSRARRLPPSSPAASSALHRGLAECLPVALTEEHLELADRRRGELDRCAWLRLCAAAEIARPAGANDAKQLFHKRT